MLRARESADEGSRRNSERFVVSIEMGPDDRPTVLALTESAERSAED